MNCPRCHTELEAVYTRNGVVVDVCSKCDGIWFDRGELSNFIEKPHLLEFLRRELLLGDGQSNTSIKCPRCNDSQMRVGKLNDNSPEIDTCPNCQGVWLDKNELINVNKALGGTKNTLLSILDDKEAQQKANEEKTIKKERTKESIEKAVSLGARLSALPNLAFGSFVILSGLYIVVFALFVFCNTFFGINIHLLALLALIVLGIQFVVSPWIMDLILKWLRSTTWVTEKELPQALRKFVKETVARNNMPLPRFGIIRDGTPNAFTYGHSPYDARIVITQGLLDVLDEDEVNAVVAHEIGHAKHWDIAIMTLAGAIPTLMYYIIQILDAGSSKLSKGKDKAQSKLGFVVLAAYIIYYISQYLILYLSRIREFYADRFAGENTGNPNLLSSALIKIAYGLAKADDSSESNKNRKNKSKELESFRAFGIFDASQARALAASSLIVDDMTPTAAFHAMQWDLWNPWAMYYQVYSTHPLPAKRILALNRQAAAYGRDEIFKFNLKKPESYWDEFFVDLAALWAPYIGFAIGAIMTFLHFGLSFFSLKGNEIIIHNYSAFSPMFIGVGIGYAISTFYSYLPRNFIQVSIATLLKRVKVSGVRPIPTIIRGKIIGRGIPGLVWSEDMVLQDESGYIFLDYRQPLNVIEFLHGLLRTPSFINKNVIVHGWYRRAPMPYVEVKDFYLDDKRYRCYWVHWKWLGAFLLIGIGLTLL